MAEIAAQLLSDLKRDFGLTNEQAAGVVGNLMYESGGFNSLQELNPTVPGSRGGFGYAQWTGSRRNSFDNFVARNGLDPASYEANYGFLKHEISSDPYERKQFNSIKRADTAAEAARLMSENFLRPGKPNLTARQNLASQALSYAGTPVPPSNIPGYGVGTLLDTRRSAPTPAIPSIAAAQMRGNTSPSGGNTALQSALDAYATRERNRVTPMTMQGKATTVATIPTTSSLTTPGAVNASVSSTRQDPALAAALARKLNPVSASDLTRGSPAQTRNVATTVASFPTAPARLPSIPASTIGSAPTTRVVPTTRVTPSASDMARGRSLPAVTTLPKATVPLTIGAQSSFAGQDRATPIAQARLPASPAGLPALYGTMSQNRVNSIGLPLSTSVAPTSGFRVTASSPTPLTRPAVFNSSQAAPVVPQRVAPTPNARPVFAARVPAPVAAPVVRQPTAQPAQRAPLNVVVQGANIVQPPPMTPVQALQAQGLSPSQAYAAANARNNQQTVYDRVRGERDSGGSGGVQPRGTIW